MTPRVTHGVKYLGSKRALLPHLERTFARLEPTSALDVFTGTTRVAQALRWMGVHVTTSDVATYSRAFSRAWVSGAYSMRAVEYVAALLDREPGVPGWFAGTYCDVPGVRGGVVRFMSPDNGARVDVVRDRVQEMLSSGEVDPVEADVLVATLIVAMDRVDNTVGIQQAYLKDWCARSLRRMSLQVYAPPYGPVGSHVEGDVLEVALPSADVAYLDPPYTPAVYLTNYHIWESVARWDKPAVDLRTNRRVDLCGGDCRSPWNGRATSADAFRRLLPRLDVRDVVVSYSDSANISLDELLDVVSEVRDVVSVEDVGVDENVMSTIGNGDGGPRGRRVEHIVHAR